MFIVIHSGSGTYIRGPFENDVDPALGVDEVVVYDVPAAYLNGSVVWNATKRMFLDGWSPLITLLVSKGILTPAEADEASGA